MNAVPATITAEVMEHADGRPVAYIDATGVAVFVWQEADGSHVVEVHTRDAFACRRLRLLVDGRILPGRSPDPGSSQRPCRQGGPSLRAQPQGQPESQRR